MMCLFVFFGCLGGFFGSFCLAVRKTWGLPELALVAY